MTDQRVSTTLGRIFNLIADTAFEYFYVNKVSNKTWPQYDMVIGE